MGLSCSWRPRWSQAKLGNSGGTMSWSTDCFNPQRLASQDRRGCFNASARMKAPQVGKFTLRLMLIAATSVLCSCLKNQSPI
jgi:hypothetical protein